VLILVLGICVDGLGIITDLGVGHLTTMLTHMQNVVIIGHCYSAWGSAGYKLILGFD
jgi:hypothetical protein